MRTQMLLVLGATFFIAAFAIALSLSRGATIRYYYDGLCNWCGAGYGPGQGWESIGAHYNPSPWRNAGMLNYIATVKSDLAARVWKRPGF